MVLDLSYLKVRLNLRVEKIFRLMRKTNEKSYDHNMVFLIYFVTIELVHDYGTALT